MRKYNFTNLFLFIACVIVVGCKDGDGTKNENPVPATPAKQCVGHDKHNHTDTRTYVVRPNLGQTCFQASTCSTTKREMINAAKQAAEDYCHDFECTGGSNNCKGVFKLISSSCTMASVVLPTGQTECRETVIINGEIDCTCK